MPESEYIDREMENHPEPEYMNDLRILRRFVLRRFVQNGSFGYGQSDDIVFQTLRARYPEANSAFGEERRRETLERYKDSPYIEEQKRTYPNNTDKEGHLKKLERLTYVMILFKLGYGSREMAMAFTNLKNCLPEAYEIFDGELENNR
jgi:hypothetical protein